VDLSGYDHVHAQTREEALSSATEQLPDLVLMDYLMPGLPPEEFITSLRRLGMEGPVLLCTGLDRDVGLEVDGVIRKPYDPDDLAKQLSRWLEQGRGISTTK
jgi:two-component system, OmpR family, phosphate regulon response regulator PhoB